MGPALLEAQILDFIRSSVEDSYEPRDLMVAGYEYLSRIPNNRIRNLAQFMLDTFEESFITVSESSRVKSLSFALDLDRENPIILYTPPTYVDVLRSTPLFSMGELVFIGSNTVDFICDRFDSGPERINRAKAYEAEYFNTVRSGLTRWMPDAHQAKLLRNYPEGLDSIDVRWYPIKFLRA